jgi:hypothetical protein
MAHHLLIVVGFQLHLANHMRSDVQLQKHLWVLYLAVLAQSLDQIVMVFL